MKYLKLTIFCFVNTLYCITGNTQTIYKDIIPDSVISNNSRDWAEYKISFADDSASCSLIVSATDVVLTNFKNLEYAQDINTGLPKVYTINKVISPSNRFIRPESGENVLLIWDGDFNSMGTWLKHNQCIGFRFKQNFSWHYGWIRFDFSYDSLNSKFTSVVKDLAFNLNPDQGITVTYYNTSVQQTETYLNFIKAYPNPFANLITIKTPTNQSDLYTITITDINGTQVIKTKLFSNSFGDIELPVFDLQAGVYFIEVSFNQNQVRKKIIKQ